MRFRASELARVSGGELIGDDTDIRGARHDSREVEGGELFVPVRGERDGHDFIGAAVRRGAAGYLTSRHPEDLGAPAIVVDDPLVALAAIGRAARGRLPERVIGITGSVGKTSTKDLAAAALRVAYPSTHASPRSFNNELGVPLTLVNAPEDTLATIVEMGARGGGHIRSLCDVARPTIAVVTTVEVMHTELFGSIDQVAVAKRELVEAVPASGTVVLNLDNEHVAAMGAHSAGDVLTFGNRRADVWAEHVRLDEELRPRFFLRTPWGDSDVQLEVRGHHNVMNALAAAGAALAAGVEVQALAEGLGKAELSPWRMQLIAAPSGARVINDAYNAGPASMAAALDALVQLDAERHLALLGRMAELGEHEAEAHGQIVALADQLGIRVIAVDAPGYVGAVVEHVDSIDAAVEAVGSLGPRDAVLVKGSRVAGLERLAALLTRDRCDT